VSDGGVLWLYEPEDQQAFKQELKASQLPAALAFLTGKGKLSAEFDITAVAKSSYGTPADYLLSLSPKVAEPQVKNILFVVDPKSFDVRESVITDGQGNLNDLTFADIKMNTHVPEAEFHFAPPPGVRVIDTAKLGK
jgi:outer membrane lipoprotein-sorting protein